MEDIERRGQIFLIDRKDLEICFVESEGGRSSEF